jgi:prepilin-type N-terminal cleavage/methylation domain-containing protein
MRYFSSLPRFSIKAFTLVELIIVIIIVGILASLGLTQYSLLVENSRTVESRTLLSTLRSDIIGYNLENGTYPSSDYQGTSAPITCVSTNYFQYDFSDGPPRVRARRCTSGGKTPNNGCAYWNILRIDGTYYSQNCSGQNFEGGWKAF